MNQSELSMEKKIIIIGAGISGLATAHWLNKKGYDFTILEASDSPGGTMQTVKKDGFLFDKGPNSGLETSPLIRELVNDVGLENEMIYANDAGNNRYILRNGTLHALPTSPPAFIMSKLFSLKAKMRLMMEPFIGKSDDGYYQSLGDFVKRRLGQEFLDYAIDPFVSGVFAGDPMKLSVKSAFPKLYRLEEVYGGLIKGMIKGAKERKQSNEESKQSAKMFTFRSGMNIFPATIAETMKDKIIYNAPVKTVTKIRDGKYLVEVVKNDKQEMLEADIVLSTIPAVNVAKVLAAIDQQIVDHCNAIYYPPVKVLYLGYKKADIKRALDGFGFLIPSLEKKPFLGAIWSSTIFDNRCPDDVATFTLFIGGAQKPHIFDKDKDELNKEVMQEFESIMNITGNPVFSEESFWEKAIPQYNIGYIEHEKFFEEFEKEHNGIFISGNLRGGISVGDCMKNSGLVADKIDKYIKDI